MEYKVLGPMEVRSRRGRITTPTAPKTRQVLALLVLRANQVVMADSLIDELWPVAPPTSALTTLQTYVYQIRKLLFGRAEGDQAKQLVTQSFGYVLEADESSIDYVRFEMLVEHARTRYANRDLEGALKRYQEALSNWRAAALVDVTKGPLLQAYTTRLEELKISTIEQTIEVRLHLGQYRDVIPDLRVLTATYPFHERFHAFLMLALHLTGRRCESLQAYQTLRTILREHLGLEPSPEVRELHQCVLSTDGHQLPAGMSLRGHHRFARFHRPEGVFGAPV